MRLYHFTTPAYLKDAVEDNGSGTGRVNIVPDRLPPLRGTLRDYGLEGDAVWLTTDPEPHRRTPGNICIRIGLVIPSTDRKLISYKKWALSTFGLRVDERYLAAAEEETGLPAWQMKRLYAGWHVYLGEIPVARFTTLDVLHDQQPWWISLNH